MFTHCDCSCYIMSRRHPPGSPKSDKHKPHRLWVCCEIVAAVVGLLGAVIRVVLALVKCLSGVEEGAEAGAQHRVQVSILLHVYTVKDGVAGCLVGTCEVLAPGETWAR